MTAPELLVIGALLVVIVGIPVLIWQVVKTRRSAERRELEQLRAQVKTQQDHPGAPADRG